jgi:hypothetical protein
MTCGNDHWSWLNSICVWALKMAAAAIALAILAVLLVGCATWSHPYKDASAFEMDLYTCQVQAGPVQDPWRAQEMQRRCMQLKGWRQ